ncbi:MAG: FecR domain-containing protein [Armatimonas sp.]
MSEETPETPMERRLRESLPEASAPESLWERIEAEGTKRKGTHPMQRRWLFPVLTTGAIAATVGGIGMAVFLRPAPRLSAWTYGERQLKIGETITASYGIAEKLYEPSIGTLTLEPETSLRITDSSKQKRLKLMRGKISARVTAPPRLFAVETDSGVATDLGCTYELEARPVRAPGILGLLGNTRSVTELTVTTGWVELLDNRGKTVLVPAGASCEMVPSSVGLPSFNDAPEALRTLHPNTNGEWPELAEALKAARRPKDTLTLFYLLQRVTEAETPRIWNRLLQLAPPPKGVIRADLLAGNPKALDAYEEHLKEIWNPSSPEFWNQLINSIRSTK